MVPETLRLLTLEELLGLRQEPGPWVDNSPPTPGRWDLVRAVAHLAAVVCLLSCGLVHGSARNDGMHVAFLLLIVLAGGEHFATAVERETPHRAERAHETERTRVKHSVSASDFTLVSRVHNEPLAFSSPSHVMRRLVVATVQCVGFSAATCSTNLNTALLGTATELLLEDGTYAGSTFTIGRDVTLRAQNVGHAVLDGENTRRVMTINSGTITVTGLNITRGSAVVSACLLNLPGT